MHYEATIEIPKGSDRRIHMAHDHSGFVDLGRIADKIPINNGVMPVHYGYLSGYHNPTEGDEVDALIFSTQDTHTGMRWDVSIVGILFRADLDHKVLATDDTVTLGHFSELPQAEQDLLLQYFGHNSPITRVGAQQEAYAYLATCVRS